MIVARRVFVGLRAMSVRVPRVGVVVSLPMPGLTPGLMVMVMVMVMVMAVMIVWFHSRYLTSLAQRSA
jgi:hypothetical protein